MIADRVGETPCVFLTGLHRAERTIAERLLRLANGKLPWPWIDPDKALPWVEGRIGLALAESPPSTTSAAELSERQRSTLIVEKRIAGSAVVTDLEGTRAEKQASKN